MTNILYCTPKHLCRSARRHTSSKSKKSFFSKLVPPLSNWGIFTIGLLCGVLLSSGIIFSFSNNKGVLKLPTEDNTRLFAQENVQEQPAVVIADKHLQEPKFEFYAELTEDLHNSNKNKKSGSQILDLKTAPKPINSYLVQAGSFKHSADADALKARLTLNGLQAKIELVKLNENEYWHRVLLGPFKSELIATEQKQLLKTLEVDAILVLKSTD